MNYPKSQQQKVQQASYETENHFALSFGICQLFIHLETKFTIDLVTKRKLSINILLTSSSKFTSSIENFNNKNNSTRTTTRLKYIT
jgi:hypothetical protein